MLAEAGCKYVIVGHSERRQIFRETDDNVAKKSLMALSVGLTPIVCVGETDEERSNGLEKEVLERQFINGPGALTADEFSRILLAYEPVWAIGTGKVATPEIAAAAHVSFAVRGSEVFGSPCLRPSNPVRRQRQARQIKGLMAQEELDGALVGGASLDPKSFASIVNFLG